MNFVVLSDIHFHNYPYARINEHGDNELFVVATRIVKDVFDYCVKNDIPTIYFLGDLFQLRNKIETDLYCNKVFFLFDKLFGSQSTTDSCVQCCLIPGNHDQINKQGDHCLYPFSKIKNVFVFDAPNVTYGDTERILLIPHQYDVDEVYRFLNVSTKHDTVMMHQLLLNSPMLTNSFFRSNEAIDSSKFDYKILFSGHNHRPFENKQLRICNVGSPMHSSFGDVECPNRYFIHYNKGKITWIPTTFPIFANNDNDKGGNASYVRRKPEKIATKDVNRLQLTKEDTMSSILTKYVTHHKKDIKDVNDIVNIGLSLLDLSKE
jgi:predicted phosphodiesterase